MHGGLLVLLVAFYGVVQQQVFNREDPLEFKIAFVPQVGPGGGGGGSPAPAPAKKMEIPKTKAPVTIPVEASHAGRASSRADTRRAYSDDGVNRAAGVGLESHFARQYGGGGRGGGVGAGQGNGVGVGTGGGFGGGAFQPGNGVSWPSILREEKPRVHERRHAREDPGPGRARDRRP